MSRTIAAAPVTEGPPRRRWIRRHRRLLGAVAIAAVGVIAFGVYWFDPEAILINHTVDEPFPAAVAMPTGSPVAAGVAAGPVSFATPAVPTTVSRGSFRSLEHRTTGAALILRLGDGSTVVRLENLDTSSGPDVHVTLSTAASTAGDRDFGDYLELGPLKGNHGNQNYAVPAGTDLTRFHSVVIWCRRFSVGFGVAPIA